MLTLRKRTDLQRLIDERLGESLTLEYKASPALNRNNDGRSELVKDATAMANSAGGQIIYGITERAGVPTGIDNGVDASIITPEWIEQVLTTNTSPRLQDLQITPIPLEEDEGKVAYVLTIPQGTVFAPHQSTLDYKYYRRFERRSVPMADYEIRDILRRSRTPLLQVQYRFLQGASSIAIRKEKARLSLVPVLENVGPEPSLYSLFELLIDARLKVREHPGGLAQRPQRSDLGYLCNSFQQILMVPNTFPLISGTSITMSPDAFVLEIPADHLEEQTSFVLGYSAVSAQGCNAIGFQLLNLNQGQLELGDHRLASLNGQIISSSDMEEGWADDSNEMS